MFNQSIKGVDKVSGTVGVTRRVITVYPGTLYDFPNRDWVLWKDIVFLGTFLPSKDTSSVSHCLVSDVVTFLTVVYGPYTRVPKDPDMFFCHLKALKTSSVFEIYI